MTHRGELPERLPTLTEVVEYVGEVMTVHSLVSAPAEAATAPPGDGPAGVPAAAEAQRNVEIEARHYEQLLEAVRRRIDASLEQRLREAIGPLVDEAARQAARISRELVDEVVRELGRSAFNASPDPSLQNATAPTAMRGGISP